MRLHLLLLLVCVAYAIASPVLEKEVEEENVKAHPVKPEEKTAAYWNKNAQKTLEQKIAKRLNHKRAKNIIIFVAEGSGVATLTSSRILEGQRNNQPGEETVLGTEFQYLGSTKTYCVNKQVPDAACSATAIFTGVKSNGGTIGLTGAVNVNNCDASLEPKNQVESILRWAQEGGKRTGLVTNSKITESTPAVTFANVANKLWQNDADVVASGVDPNKCTDIASQLINGETGKNLNVILGGGRVDLLPLRQVDEDGNRGKRIDGVNLIAKWKLDKAGEKSKYVADKHQLANVPKDVDYLLGLFAGNNLPFNLDRDTAKTPSLKDLVQSALKVLTHNDKKGFALVVDASNIDRAHHLSQAQKALDETIQLAKAVKHAVDTADRDETLVLVVADHASTLTISGNPPRGNDILGVAGVARDSLEYATLNYANGPGYRTGPGGSRHDISQDNLRDKDYSFPSLAPLDLQVHGGTDALILARGPGAHHFSGVYEQNVIPHLVSRLACLRDTPCIQD